MTAAGLRPVPRAGRGRCTRSAGPPPSPSPRFPSDAAPRAHGVAAGHRLRRARALARAGSHAAARPASCGRAVTVAASVVLTGLLGWFVVELQGDGDLIGLSERAVAGAQAIWPLVVVVALRRATPGAA